jgi:biopolymer transport protein ExbD
MPIVSAWPIVIQADRKVAAGTLLRVMFTLKRREQALLVEGFADARLIFLDMPQRWKGEESEKRPAPEARVDRTHIHIMSHHGKALEPISLENLEAIDSAARTLRDQSDQFWIALHVADDVLVEQLVAVLDALRGRGCHAIGDESHNCTLWATVDFDPPAPRRSGDWSRLELSLLPTQERRPPKWMKPQAAAVEAAIPRIRECLRQSWIARAEMPEWIGYLFAIDEDGKIGVRPVMPTRSDDALSTCLRTAVGDYAEKLPPNAKIHSLELAVECPES